MSRSGAPATGTAHQGGVGYRTSQSSDSRIASPWANRLMGFGVSFHTQISHALASSQAADLTGAMDEWIEATDKQR